MLEYGAEHLVGRLATRYIFQQVRIVVLGIVYPPRRARCNEREFTLILYPIKKLCCLFHYCKVCCVIGIENLLEAESPERGNHLSSNIRSNREAELFAECNTNCRCRLYNNVLSRPHRFINLLYLASLHESTGGAY